MSDLVSQEMISSKIYIIRNKKVLLDRDLAQLYGVSTKVLNQAVQRNRKRFPDDFMFQLNKQEYVSLRSQIVTSNRGGQRYLPYVFTEQGVAMLSGVLQSDRAIKVNIQIMRTFTQLRHFLSTHRDIQQKIEEILQVHGRKLKEHDEQIKIIFEAINQLLQPPEEPKKKYGFLADRE